MSDTGGVMSCLKWMWHHKYCGLVWYSGCDVICSAKDVTHMLSMLSSTQRVVMSYLVDIMSLIEGIWCHRYTGCDTIHIVAVMLSIEWVWWHRYSAGEVRYTVVDDIHKVMWCPKEWMWCHIEENWCHECSVCDVLEHDHWCHKVWIWCDVDWVWYHKCAKCDDLHTCCDVIDTVIHRYRCVCHLCDDTDTVALVSKWWLDVRYRCCVAMKAVWW